VSSRILPQRRTARDIVNHLAGHGLISLAAVVAGDLALIEVPRRNQNLKVVVRQGCCYFVKQAIDSSSRRSLAREADFYRFVSSRPTGNALARYLPKFYDHDSDAHLLVLELAPTSRDLLEHYERARRSAKPFARLIGRALAALHNLTASDQASTSFGHSFAADMPWILSLYEPSVAILGRASAANLKLVRMIQGYAGFSEALQRLSLEWRKDRLIHFDVKSENIVVVPGPSGRWTRLKLVDWEFVGFGDACWDIGSVFADYLGRWLLAMPPIEENNSEPLLDLNSRQLVETQAGLGAFWKEYLSRMPLAPQADRWLVRSVEYAATRLLQRCYEQLQMSTDLTYNSVRMLQVSQNMLHRPEEAAVRLLGLPLHLTAP
jgi:thiamine kinase-like enzyme